MGDAVISKLRSGASTGKVADNMNPCTRFLRTLFPLFTSSLFEDFLTNPMSRNVRNSRETAADDTRVIRATSLAAYTCSGLSKNNRSIFTRALFPNNFSRVFIIYEQEFFDFIKLKSSCDYYTS